ncbi:MAG: Type 1 glutamine amidotransferase-like domain-containing protein [Nostocoides sp.]
MASDPTILATSGGYRPGSRTMLEFNLLVEHAVTLSGATGRRPRIGYLGTAIGDQEFYAHRLTEAARVAGFDLTEVRLFPMPNVSDIQATLSEQDVVWVTGGSVANLLAVWRVHGLDDIFRTVWQRGVVLAGVSAGSICWFTGGCTDSFGPDLQPVTNGLRLLPYANGVHYDHEEQRRPTIHRLVADGVLGETHCTDDGVGLHYRGTDLVEAVAERDHAYAYRVTKVGAQVVEEQLPTRRLG